MEIKIKKDKKGEVKKSTPKKEVEQEMITESLEDINNIVMDEDIEENQLNKDLELVDIESLEWNYEIKEKNILFYFVLFGVATLFIYLAYKYDNWMIALIVILGFVMIIQRNSKINNFKIDNEGVKVQKQEFKWENISRCGIEELNQNTLLLTLIPNSFPNFKIYIPFEREKEREILSLINKYSKFSDIKSNFFDQITKKIMF
jgi:hypothetical protein